MAPEEENDITKAQRQLYLSHKVIYDTTPMFPPKPLPCGIKLVTDSGIMDSIEALRKSHTADMVVSASSVDSDLTLVSTKSRGVTSPVTILDSMSQYGELNETEL